MFFFSVCSKAELLVTHLRYLVSPKHSQLPPEEDLVKLASQS